MTSTSSSVLKRERSQPKSFGERCTYSGSIDEGKALQIADDGRKLVEVTHEQVIKDALNATSDFLDTDCVLTSSPTFTLRDSGGGFPLLGG
ncbi:hypothetical protein N6B35_28610 (plasmid) [Klebsiella michiganensis]|uniref:hypothetical protein n=1 Tax=Klebsiella michiganensis TaxID=1134687 RepID=UPI0021D90378|nr:hypothetical protein [Klebsiella michiganensis]UYB60239.1 hypothetical protein N6B35_28610 [Klebsiella michiganensis]